MKYRKKAFDQQFLEKHMFEEYRTYSEAGNQAWQFRFPVYRQGIDIEIDCEIVMWHSPPSWLDTNVTVNVYDGKFGQAKYAPWYLGENPHNINKKIAKKLKDLEVEIIE